MPEQQNIEYKSSWHDDYLKWICGFANAQGGIIFIGKDDNGKLVGVQKAQISKIETSMKNARFETILKVFEALGAKVNFNVELDHQKLAI